MGASRCEWISRVLVFTVYILVGAGNASVLRVLPGVMLVCEVVERVGEGAVTYSGEVLAGLCLRRVVLGRGGGGGGV